MQNANKKHCWWTKTYKKYLIGANDKCLMNYCGIFKQYLLPCIGCSKYVEILHIQHSKFLYQLFRQDNFTFFANECIFICFLKRYSRRESISQNMNCNGRGALFRIKIEILDVYNLFK